MKGIIVENLDDAQINKRQLKSWPVWEKEVSCFDWEYESDEECYILDGEVNIETENGNVLIKAGDFVTFQKGLKCVWDNQWYESQSKLWKQNSAASYGGYHCLLVRHSGTQRRIKRNRD